MKYLKYYLSTFLLLSCIYVSTLGAYGPTIFLVFFSTFIIVGDSFIGKDILKNKYSYPFLINLPIYINLFFLSLLVSIIVYVLGDGSSKWYAEIINSALYIDLIYLKSSIVLVDKISFIIMVSLMIGIVGTVPGHELTHRKKNKFDMFIGNWLLAFSWDCAFALEHVYGHHKNVCLPNDPATAKRGQGLYSFIFLAIIKEQIDAWKIEKIRLQKRHEKLLSLNNKMIVGYFRSLLLTFLAFLIGGIKSLLIFILCAIIAKCLLEVINYTEHYGLVREPNKPVEIRHSWNSNNILSSILLYNVTRHSAHHQKANLKFWELDAYPYAPSMPYGYLSMLYIAIFLPFVYRKIMDKKLVDWDKNHATPQERKIAMTYCN